MSFGSYSTTPSANTSCIGINIDENCPAANINNVLRQLMADGRELYDIVSAISVSSYMPLSGGSFTGTVLRAGAGAYSFYASPAMVGGAEYVQPISFVLPTSAVEGTKVFQY